MSDSDTRPMRHGSLSNADPLDILQLLRSENIGPATFFSLTDYYGSVREAIKAVPALSQKSRSKRPIKLCPREKAETEYAAIEAYGAHIIPYGHTDYPDALLTIDDAPPLLMVSGSPSIWQKPCIAIVGARNASATGCQFARQMAIELGEAGYAIISGLARGVDGFAHQGSLKTGTVGVIAGGINTIYPPEHKGLFAQLAEQGAIISEAPFSATPQARHFPARNRIIAGISKAVIVIEAAARSGSLITARMALDYGREVCAVPGSPLDPRSEGSNMLIKQGSHVATCSADIIEALRSPRPFELSEALETEFESEIYADMEGSNNTNSPPLDHATLRQELLSKLSPSPVLLDELVWQCQTQPQIVHRLLTEMELSGEIERHAGGRVSKVTESA